VEILNDKNEKIHGINIEYNQYYKSNLYPTSIEKDLVNIREMSLNSKDKSSSIEAITHIYGTIDKESGYITFIGFKCNSGKTVFSGTPKGDGFLFGHYGYKLHDITMEITEEGITRLEPEFKPTMQNNNLLIDNHDKLLKIEDIIQNKDKGDIKINNPLFVTNQEMNNNKKEPSPVINPLFKLMLDVKESDSPPVKLGSFENENENEKKKDEHCVKNESPLNEIISNEEDDNDNKLNIDLNKKVGELEMIINNENPEKKVDENHNNLIRLYTEKEAYKDKNMKKQKEEEEKEKKEKKEKKGKKEKKEKKEEKKVNIEDIDSISEFSF
jgi:hypothetical protein